MRRSFLIVLIVIVTGTAVLGMRPRAQTLDRQAPDLGECLVPACAYAEGEPAMKPVSSETGIPSPPQKITSKDLDDYAAAYEYCLVDVRSMFPIEFGDCMKMTGYDKARRLAHEAKLLAVPAPRGMTLKKDEARELCAQENPLESGTTFEGCMYLYGHASWAPGHTPAVLFIRPDPELARRRTIVTCSRWFKEQPSIDGCVEETYKKVMDPPPPPAEE